jgi:hypothetical protein
VLDARDNHVRVVIATECTFYDDFSRQGQPRAWFKVLSGNVQSGTEFA